MKVIYAILLTAGWVWLPIAAALVWWRLWYLGRASLPARRGFEVIVARREPRPPDGTAQNG